ncbi:MAG: dephospho-CoA kinase [Candidatus Omnitrophica bacterium]|nr:dephospho-CoA kinase [Candidatus Omnitrophota bacterium]
MKVIGLTGSFGTGKTFVASLFKSKGAKVLDADAIAHECITKGTPVFKKIVRAFGKRVLRPRGEIDRKKLAKIVFGNKKALARLNSLVHPEVIQKLRARIRRCGPEDIVVIDAPLLIEAGAKELVDKLIVVTCPKKRQIERCVKKFRIKRQEVMKRIASQIPLKRKIKIADFVIDNGKTKNATKRQVEKLWKEIAWK